MNQNLLPYTEIEKNIFVITQTLSFGKSKFSVNIYYLAGKNGLIFDSGYGKNTLAEQLVQTINQIIKKSGKNYSAQKILPSHGHWDHFSGLTYVSNKLNLEVCAVKSQIPAITSKKIYQTYFRAENRFSRKPTSSAENYFFKIKEFGLKKMLMTLLGIKFYHGKLTHIQDDTCLTVNQDEWWTTYLPGHSDDDIALYNESSGILLSGDILLNKIPTWLGPPRSDLIRYLHSLAAIKRLPNLKLILPAHGRSVTDPLLRIQQAIDHRKKRTKDLFDLIGNAGNKGIHYDRIFQTIYPKYPMMQKNIYEGWICITLEFLIARDYIKAIDQGNQTLFTIKKPFVPEMMCHS